MVSLVQAEEEIQSKGYSIPTIDLSKQAHRQIIVDREKGQYLGHPSTVLLEDNKTMLVVYPKGHGRGGIVYKRSNDGGLTWSSRLPTPKNWETSKEVHLFTCLPIFGSRKTTTPCKPTIIASLINNTSSTMTLGIYDKHCLIVFQQNSGGMT